MFVDRSRLGRTHDVAAGPARARREKTVPRDPLALDVRAIAGSGFYLALRVSYAFPVEEVNELPKAWVDQYTRSGFLMADPVIRWVHGSEGFCRWSELPISDPRQVLVAAREHGLEFGAAVSHVGPEGDGLRSFGCFARSDREFTDEEMQLLLSHVRARHDAMAPPRNITAAEIEALRLIKEGQRLKQIAHQLGVTEGAVKQRLKNARLKLSAKTGAEAISRATAFGLI